ncbi:hypothetical protein OGAPHI_003295 [Ogataea philodendri]|uniref:Uncharacterized protein n=1 Tax=Ogataea philodendri TaxID=1378263 RepID=A0A9P8T6D0_9ASCO|nr:uncharacterized protein OGAPHI_003295 [Ogataea philodendri]KAH3666846.1 hypothetical protein OGAPHI_003295 [Ogataea philodendri]
MMSIFFGFLVNFCDRNLVNHGLNARSTHDLVMVVIPASLRDEKKLLSDEVCALVVDSLLFLDMSLFGLDSGNNSAPRKKMNVWKNVPIFSTVTEVTGKIPPTNGPAVSPPYKNAVRMAKFLGRSASSTKSIK